MRKPAKRKTAKEWEEHMKSAGRAGGLARKAALTPTERTAAARKAGRAGGVARKKNLTPQQRKESAAKAAKARWGKKAL